ncbi:hypothetical protein H0O21_12540 [Synechococcus sp. HK01-R]|nr:hypothetical protein H0O21_12540 [Synechococcus sp. HK01-R]
MTSPTGIELMTSVYPRRALPSPALTAVATVLQRTPERITCTVPWAVKDQLQRRADEEGRSLSGLLAFLLERSLSE